MCTSAAPASKAAWALSICSAGAIGRAGFCALVGWLPVMATVMMAGVDMKEARFLPVCVYTMTDIRRLVSTPGAQGCRAAAAQRFPGLAGSGGLTNTAARRAPRIRVWSIRVEVADPRQLRIRNNKQA